MALALEQSAIEAPSATDPVRPRDLIRRYAIRELGALDAWQSALDGRLYPQMWESKRALESMVRLIDLLDAHPEAVALLAGKKRKSK